VLLPTVAQTPVWQVTALHHTSKKELFEVTYVNCGTVWQSPTAELQELQL
jgi:hypothetical protein